MNYFSLNNIKDLFELFVQNHFQLKRFGFGIVPDVEQIISDKQTFPVLYANLIDIQYPTDNLKTFNFNILIFDLLKNDKSNEQDVWSDCIQVGEDFIRFLNHNSNDYYQIIGQSRIETFTERFTDFVAGCNLNLSIQVDSNLQNDCGIPLEGFDLNMPSFLASGGTPIGSNFTCEDLLGCDLFTGLSGQSQANYDNIVVLSGNQSSFVLSSVFETYTANTQTNFDNYLPLSGGTVNGKTILKIESGNSISNSIFSSTGNTISFDGNSDDDDTDFFTQGSDLFGEGIKGTILGRANVATGESAIMALGDLANGGLSNYSIYATAIGENEKSSSVSIENGLVTLTSTSGTNQTYLGVADGQILLSFKQGGYLLPNTSGTSGQVIMNDGSNHTYWANINQAKVQPGLNTYTGGTALYPTVNISAATLSSLSSSTISGGTFYSGSTPLSTVINNIALSLTGLTTSATTIYSGTSGALFYQSGTTLYQDASNLFYNSITKSLGVGTNAPNSKVHIRGTGTTVNTYALTVQNSSNQDILRVDNSSSVIVGSITGSDTSSLTIARPQPSPATIASGGYIYIGGGEYGAGKYRLIKFGYATPVFIGYQEETSFDYTRGDLVFGTRPTTVNVDPTERMRIKADGSIGIGTNLSTSRLHIKGSGATSSTSAFRVDTSTNAPSLYVGDDVKVGVGTAAPNSTLQVSGSASFSYAAKAANYTASTTDYTIDCTANSFSVTLPTAVSIAGRVYVIKNSGSGVISANTTSAQTIDGTTLQTLNQWDVLRVQSTGSNWIKI